jgi:hypothetical protein
MLARKYLQSAFERLKSGLDNSSTPLPEKSTSVKILQRKIKNWLRLGGASPFCKCTRLIVYTRANKFRLVTYVSAIAEQAIQI